MTKVIITYLVLTADEIKTLAEEIAAALNGEFSVEVEPRYPPSRAAR